MMVCLDLVPVGRIGADKGIEFVLVIVVVQRVVELQVYLAATKPPGRPKSAGGLALLDDEPSAATTVGSTRTT